MSTVLDVIEEKGRQVITVAPFVTVFNAISRMAERSVGALIVVCDDEVVGMVTERDYLRKVALRGRTSRSTLVEAIMTTPVICVSPERSLDECMAIMTERRIRHLPVVERDQLVGVVSMGDLVRRRIWDQEFEINNLVCYIQGAPSSTGFAQSA
jgi:CBS domain-containing protein